MNDDRPTAANLVVALHCLTYLAFILATTFGTYYVSVHHTEYFIKRFAPVLFCTSLGMFALWPVFGGCPLTWLENRILGKANPALRYEGSCTNRYAESWFGLVLPRRCGTLFLVGNMLLPAGRWLYLWW